LPALWTADVTSGLYLTPLKNLLLLNAMHRMLLILLSFLMIAAAPKKPVIVSIIPSPPLEIAIAEKGEYLLELKILKGYHIQSNPASENYLIPVTATFETVDGIEIGEPVYPSGILFRLKGSQKDISTYEDTVRIKIPVQAKSKAKPGDVVLKGTLRYQGCDALLCFPPTKLPFEVKLKVVTK
jgi:Thiol:disulfide interchange protein DsbD, N-terminal